MFSCGALHEVTPITRGRRYAFIPFLYGEADAALRHDNNARLHDSEALYSGEDDRLYPRSPPNEAWRRGAFRSRRLDAGRGHSGAAGTLGRLGRSARHTLRRAVLPSNRRALGRWRDRSR